MRSNRATCSAADAATPTTLREVRGSKRLDNAVVVLVSDHGEALGGLANKNTAYLYLRCLADDADPSREDVRGAATR